MKSKYILFFSARWVSRYGGTDVIRFLSEPSFQNIQQPRVMNKLHRTCILQLQQLLLNTEIDELIQASNSCLQINFIICAPARIAVSIFPIHPSHPHQSYLWDPNTHTILLSLPTTITFPSSPSPRTPHFGSRIQFCRSIPSTTHTATPVSAVTSSTNPQFLSIKSVIRELGLSADAVAR